MQQAGNNKSACVSYYYPGTSAS